MSEKYLDFIVCSVCYRSFSKTGNAVKHMIFAHHLRYPYWVYFWKGLLGDPSLGDLSEVVPPDAFWSPSTRARRGEALEEANDDSLAG